MSLEHVGPLPPGPLPTPRPPGRVNSVTWNMRRDAEKRRHYRVLQATVPTLQVCVSSSNGSKCTGRCQDISLGGAGVRFVLDQDPGLEVGQEIVLDFESAKQEEPIQLSARVHSKRALESIATRYVFTFMQPEEVEAHAAGSWGRWFNRRRYRRLAPDLGTGLPAQLRWRRGHIDGRLIDISMGGLGLTIPATRAPELLDVTEVVVSVVLADKIGELRFNAIVRSDCAGPSPAHVRLEFVRDGLFDKSGPILLRWIERIVKRRMANVPPVR